MFITVDHTGRATLSSASAFGAEGQEYRTLPRHRTEMLFLALHLARPGEHHKVLRDAWDAESPDIAARKPWQKPVIRGVSEREGQTYFRACSVEGCTYKEARGSREDDVPDGKFMCDKHALLDATQNGVTIKT